MNQEMGKKQRILQKMSLKLNEPHSLYLIPNLIHSKSKNIFAISISFMCNMFVILIVGLIPQFQPYSLCFGTESKFVPNMAREPKWLPTSAL